MKIVLVTPLYPPDIEESAQYVKELAHRIAKDNIITVVTYGYLPEKVPNIKIIAVDKRRPLLLRITAFILTLRRATRGADIVYVQNGASTELPLLFVSSFSKTFFVFGISDKKAYAKTSFFARVLKRAITMRVRTTVKDFPLERPEILPFSPYPKDAFVSYEHSWNTHLKQLLKIFHHDI